ncbi:helix-turn-helix domain-containing protein [Methylosinus sp. Sm6]|uniref:helix-turn-helix domain-containing protein n=1 Tax=Methylosinus sp. Sm6 TaxID=2866948 RepID=UPI001C992390|nr:helix-turn-helix domain-containing protein [Methylosinus sp. Sm6]
MSEYHYLPGLLREIADVAGLPAALAIAEEKGGARVHFPARASEAHWLVRLIGREAADKLCEHFRTAQGGARELVPLGPRNFYAQARRKAARLAEEGCSREEVARRLGVHIRTVQRYRARGRDEGDSRQGRLF